MLFVVPRDNGKEEIGVRTNSPQRKEIGDRHRREQLQRLKGR